MRNYNLQERIEKLIKGLLSGDYKWNTEALDIICGEMYYKTEHGEEPIDPNEILDEALELKRQGNYELALIYYLDVVDGTLSINAGVPAKVIWAMSKVLISANEYLYAFLLLNDCIRVLMPYSSFLNDEEKYILANINTYISAQRRMCISVKNREFSMLQLITQQYSGNPNYQFVLSFNEIVQQYQVIETLKNYAR